MSRHLHATAIILGEKGVLILGQTGAGKSSLADALIERARERGRHACLIGDDRIALSEHHGRLVISGHPAIRGRIERRGIGIVDVNATDKAVLHAVIVLEADPPRLPEKNQSKYTISGVEVPLLTLRSDRDLASKAHLALDWLEG